MIKFNQINHNSIYSHFKIYIITSKVLNNNNPNSNNNNNLYNKQLNNFNNNNINKYIKIICQLYKIKLIIIKSINN